MKYINNFLLICFLLVITLSGCKTNYKETDSSYFKFRSAYSDYIEIYEFDKKNFNDEQLIIPSKYEGKKVIYITEGVFDGLRSVKIVKIPKHLQTLEKNFNNCESLENVILNKEIEGINYCFVNCPKLKEIEISNSVHEIRDSFNGCASLKEIEFNNNIKLIGSSFQKCSSIEKITIPSSLEQLSISFYDCLSLKVLIQYTKNYKTL